MASSSNDSSIGAGSQVAVSKPKILSMLSFMFFTGLPPFDGKTCVAAMELAVQHANSRSDILPGYAVKLQHVNDNSGNLIPVGLFGFLNSKANSNASNGITSSPLVLGPFQTTGCKVLGSLVKHVDMVGLGIACFDPALAQNRRTWPNFWRASPGNNYIAFSMFKLMKLANWNKVAILTYALNSGCYNTANLFYQQALNNGFNVLAYESTMALDMVTAVRVKATDARIIFIHTHLTLFALNGLCTMYQVGMRSPRYVFIGWIQQFIQPEMLDPRVLNPGCTLDIIYEQLKTTFWTSSPFGFSIDNLAPNSFGYNVEEFDARLDTATNSSRTPEYAFRHRCHDIAMEAILVLDKAERQLQANYSLTLSDYQNDELKPLISGVVNASFNVLNFSSLKYGSDGYSRRAELDLENQYVLQWSNKTWRLLGEVINSGGIYSNNASLDNFTYIERNSPIWATPNGKPPRDFPISMNIQIVISIQAFGTIVAIAGVLILLQIALFCIELFKAKRSKDFEVTNLGFHDQRCIGLIGTMLLNGSAIAFAFQTPDMSICHLRPALLALGQSLISGHLVGILLRYSKMVAKNRKSTNKEERDVEQSKHERHLFLSIFIPVALTAIALIVWFASDPLKLSLCNVGGVSYDVEADAYIQNEYLSCYSDNAMDFILVLVFANILCLAVGSFLAYETRKYQQISWFPMVSFDLQMFRLATWNSTMLLLVGSIIVFELNNWAWEQQTAVAALILVQAAMTTVFISGIQTIRGRFGSVEDARRSSYIGQSMGLSTKIAKSSIYMRDSTVREGSV